MSDEIKKYSDNPQLLIELLSCVIDNLESNNNNETIKQKSVQLYEINKAIKALEKKGITVPDSLRSEKTKLFNEINLISTMPKLQIIQNGLEDIMRNLKIDEQPVKKIRRPRTSMPKTDSEVLRGVLLDVLKSFGGKARVSDIKSEMGKKLEGKLLAGDLEYRSDGKTLIWFNNVQWERLRLVEAGILKNDSPKGLWELAGDEG